jgi:hypothetical protein
MSPDLSWSVIFLGSTVSNAQAERRTYLSPYLTAVTRSLEASGFRPPSLFLPDANFAKAAPKMAVLCGKEATILDLAWAILIWKYLPLTPHNSFILLYYLKIIVPSQSIRCNPVAAWAAILP